MLFLSPPSVCPLCLQYKESGVKYFRHRARAKALGWEQLCLFRLRKVEALVARGQRAKDRVVWGELGRGLSI